MFVLATVSLLLLRIPSASRNKGWLPISFFLVFTFISNILFGQGKILYNLGAIVITEGGIYSASMRTLRIFFMVAGAKILTASTPTEILVCAFGNILSPLEKTGAPVREFFSLMRLTLKCFPKLKEHLAENYRNHRGQGELQGFFGKARFISLFLFPMFVQSMESPEMFFEEKIADNNQRPQDAKDFLYK